MGTLYRQLNEYERVEIHRLHAAGVSCSKIGTLMGRDKSTISRELKRNALSRSGYLPHTAERMALMRRHQIRCSKIQRSSQLQTTVIDSLAMGMSPEQIAGRLEREHHTPVISHESIYRFVYSRAGRANRLHLYLLRGKARRGRRTRHGKPLIPHRICIRERSKAADTRTEFGHWEGDLMAFSKAGNPIVVATERTTRFILAQRQSGKTATVTRQTLHDMFRPLPSHARRSATFDNGGEFALHHTLGMQTFFCDPRSPWQKGGVENAIGRLRADLPRSTKSTDYSEQDIQEIIHIHNSTPRKCLNYMTPHEAFLGYINRCT